jgi:hypothetical protein
MRAFEMTERVTLEVRLCSSVRGDSADIQVSALAHSAEHEIGEVPPLASVRLTFLGTHLKTLDAVVFQCLYALDFQLAANAYAEIRDLKA